MRIFPTLSTLLIAALSSVAVMADPVIDTTVKTDAPEPIENFLSAITPSDGNIYTGDYYMPTLAELLGEPVDDLAHLDDSEELREDMVEYAKRYLGSRYGRGGKGPKAFDCSGFTSFVFKNFGIQLSPSSSAQGLQGTRIDLANVEVGDLLFFSGRGGGKRVGHVGMVVSVDHEAGTLEFIHSSSSQGVVIQNFPDGGYYSKRYLHASRVIDED